MTSALERLRAHLANYRGPEKDSEHMPVMVRRADLKLAVEALDAARDFLAHRYLPAYVRRMRVTQEMSVALTKLTHQEE